MKSVSIISIMIFIKSNYSKNTLLKSYWYCIDNFFVIWPISTIIFIVATLFTYILILIKIWKTFTNIVIEILNSINFFSKYLRDIFKIFRYHVKEHSIFTAAIKMYAIFIFSFLLSY